MTRSTSSLRQTVSHMPLAGSPRARRGGTGAKVLLILSAIFLLVGIGGFFVARSAVMNDLFPLATTYFKDLKNSTAITHVVSPGESSIKADGEGGMLFVVTERYELDGKEYTFAPGGKLNLTLKGSDGKSIEIVKPGRGQAIDVETDKVHIVGFAPLPKADTYTLAIDGQDTVVHVAALTGGDWQTLVGGLKKAVWGGLAGCCATPLFALFGIIGGIMMIFGKKQAPMP